jgi:hypothetical protein
LAPIADETIAQIKKVSTIKISFESDLLLVRSEGEIKIATMLDNSIHRFIKWTLGTSNLISEKGQKNRQLINSPPKKMKLKNMLSFIFFTVDT